MRLRPTMLRLLAALALCFGVAASLAPPAAAYDVMLDASGSMEGFRRAQGGVWARLLEALERGAGRKFYFGDETESWNGPLLQVRLNHQRTRLDDALSTWLEDSRAGDAVIMVTDNAADERSEDSLQSQERFYDQLTRSDSHITHISVIPTRLKFDGSIFHPLNALPTQRYRGDRALALYLMVRDSGDDTAFRALRQTVKGVLDSLGLPYQELPIRPFGEGWSSSLGSGSIGIEARSDAPGTNVRLDENGALSITGFSIGDNLRFTIRMTVNPGPGFTIQGAQPTSSITFENAAFLTADQRVRTSVPGGPVTLGSGNSRIFPILFDISPFNFLNVPFATKVRLALANSTTVRGTLTLGYSAQPQQLSLDAAGQQWSYDGGLDDLVRPDAAVQGRIYHLNTLIQRMVQRQGSNQPALLQQPLRSIPVTLELRYPAGPVIGLLVLLLAVLLLLGILLYRLAKSHAYVVEDDAGVETVITPGLMQAVEIPSSDRRASVRLRSFGLGMGVSSNGRLTTGRFLTGDRNRIGVVVSDDGERLSYTFRIRRQRRERGGGDPLDDWSGAAG